MFAKQRQVNGRQARGGDAARQSTTQTASTDAKSLTSAGGCASLRPPMASRVIFCMPRRPCDRFLARARGSKLASLAWRDPRGLLVVGAGVGFSIAVRSLPPPADGEISVSRNVA